MKEEVIKKMCILMPVVVAALFVFLGYCTLWSSSQGNTPKDISQFGKILSIILFTIAGLVIVLCSLFRCSPMNNRMMAGRPGCQGMMRMGTPPERGCRPNMMMDKEHKGGFVKENEEDDDEKGLPPKKGN